MSRKKRKRNLDQDIYDFTSAEKFLAITKITKKIFPPRPKGMPREQYRRAISLLYAQRTVESRESKKGRREKYYQEQFQQTPQRLRNHSGNWWDDYNKYLSSPHWREFRRSALQSAGMCCQRCGASKTKDKLQVHHLHYNSLGEEKLTDVQVLCLDCHKKEHSTNINMQHGSLVVLVKNGKVLKPFKQDLPSTKPRPFKVVEKPTVLDKTILTWEQIWADTKHLENDL